MKVLSQFTGKQDSAADTAQTITIAAVAGMRHFVTQFWIGCHVLGTGSFTVELREGATVKWFGTVAASAILLPVPITFSLPLRFAANTAVNLVIGAGAGGAISRANIMGFTEKAV